MTNSIQTNLVSAFPPQLLPIKELLRPHYAELIGQLKVHEQLSIKDLSEALGLSYMATKQHCEKLVANGFLETWRQPREIVGRPVILFRLTQKTEVLFPTVSHELLFRLLSSANKLYGATAAERILLKHLQDQYSAISEKIHGHSVADKAQQLCLQLVRYQYAIYCQFSPEFGLHLKLYQHPLSSLFADFPNIPKLEMQLMESLIGTKINKVESPNSKILKLGTLGSPMP